MMTESEKELFNKRICVGNLLVSANVYVTPSMTESAAEVELTFPDDDYQKAMDLYDRICEFALLHGEDLQGLFQTERYCYMSCFVRDIEAFKKAFENEAELKTIFNHDKGETAEFLISFPECLNYENKDDIKKNFIDIIQKHVDTVDRSIWKRFEERALSGDTVGPGFDINTGEIRDTNTERKNILKMTRKEFVRSTLTDSFEPIFYVDPLFSQAEKIGDIDGHDVWFNIRGFYFYWNKETEYLLESWLTFPAYPYDYPYDW